jgi:lipoprotein-releasing system ATP-binding protein
MPDLVVEQLTKEYPSAENHLRILRGVSLAMSAGENLAILGPSGAGKSTLLHILGGLDSPTSGTVNLKGVNPFGLPPGKLAEFRNTHVGFIFQDHYLLAQLTALQNVLVPVLAQHSVNAAHIERARMLLGEVGLKDRLTHRPSQLSGGERQRVAVARALIMKPILLLADEPTGSLDSANAQTVGKILCELPERQSTILICVTHSETLANHFQKRAYLGDGKLIDQRPVVSAAVERT